MIKSYKRPCFMLLRPDEKEARAGRRVSVLWPDENRRFTGVIDGYNADDDVHTIAYDDGTVEHHVLADEDVHFIEPSGVVLRPIRMLAAEKKRVAKRRVAVFWPLEKTWFTGIVDARDAETKQHTIVYDDGEVERIEMVKEKVKSLDWPGHIRYFLFGFSPRNGARPVVSTSSSSAFLFFVFGLFSKTRTFSQNNAHGR